MNFSEGFQQSLEVIRSNKVRSFLTILGINFGVGCLIAISVVGLAFRSFVSGELGQYGSTLVWIQVNWQAYAEGEPRTFMEEQDLLYFKRALSGVEAGESEFSQTLPVSHGGETIQAQTIGVSWQHFDIYSIDVEKGRSFLEEEERRKAAVAVIRPGLAAQLFGTDNPLGKTIRVDRKSFTVLGVTEEKTDGFISDSSDNNSLYVPQEYMASKMWGGGKIRYWFYMLKMDSLESVDLAEERIQSYLHNKYGPLREESRFRINRLDSYVKVIDNILNIVSLLVLVIAGISIVVGGLGIMNIMLVAVTERTREIGVRRAVGARRRDILIQFVIEAVTLCLIGGGTGVIFGTLLGALVCMILNWPFLLSLSIVTLALVLSSAIGMVFGIYPAYKASKLPPMEALRSEV